MLIENSNIYLDKQAKKRDNKIEIDPHQELEVGDYVLMPYPTRPPAKISSIGGFTEIFAEII